MMMMMIINMKTILTMIIMLMTMMVMVIMMTRIMIALMITMIIMMIITVAMNDDGKFLLEQIHRRTLYIDTIYILLPSSL